MSGSLQETFEKKWDDEADLEFEAEPDPSPSVSERRTSQRKGKGTSQMAHVPDAPYHPDLRPAGIAELQKRERRKKELEEECGREEKDEDEANLPPLSRSGGEISSDPLTDLSSSDPLFPEDSGAQGAQAWFERIDDRRSSEFGSFRSD